MAREAFTRLLWMVLGLIVLCAAIGIVRTLREFVFPTYSGFSFYQPLFAIPFHIAVSLMGMGIAQFLAWVFKLAVIQSSSGNFFVGVGYSVATLIAFLAEKHLPQSFGSPGSTHMLFVLLALAMALCVTVRLVFAVQSLRRHP